MRLKKPKTEKSRIRVIDKMELEYMAFGHQFPEEGTPIKIGGRILESHYEDMEVPEGEEDLEARDAEGGDQEPGQDQGGGNGKT